MISAVPSGAADFLHASLQSLDVGIDAVQLVRNLDALRAMLHALAAAYTVVSLAQGRDGLVVGSKVSLAELAEILLLLALGNRTLIHALVVMRENARNIYTVRTRHTVIAMGTIHRRILSHKRSHLLHERQLLFVHRLEIHERLEIVLQMLHVGHSAEHCQYPRVRAHETESP